MKAQTTQSLLNEVIKSQKIEVAKKVTSRRDCKDLNRMYGWVVDAVSLLPNSDIW